MFFKHFNQALLHRLSYGFKATEKLDDDKMVEFDAPWAPNQPNYENGGGYEEDDFDRWDPSSYCYNADGNGDWAVGVCMYHKSVACEELGYLEGWIQKRTNVALLQRW